MRPMNWLYCVFCFWITGSLAAIIPNDTRPSVTILPAEMLRVAIEFLKYTECLELRLSCRLLLTVSNEAMKERAIEYLLLRRMPIPPSLRLQSRHFLVILEWQRVCQVHGNKSAEEYLRIVGGFGTWQEGIDEAAVAWRRAGLREINLVA